MGPPRESSVRNLLEKVGNLRVIAVLVQLNLAFLTFIDLHLHSQIVSDYHPLFFNGFFEVNFFWMQWRGPVFSRSSSNWTSFQSISQNICVNFIFLQEIFLLKLILRPNLIRTLNMETETNVTSLMILLEFYWVPVPDQHMVLDQYHHTVAPE